MSRSEMDSNVITCSIFVMRYHHVLQGRAGLEAEMINE